MYIYTFVTSHLSVEWLRARGGCNIYIYTAAVLNKGRRAVRRPSPTAVAVTSSWAPAAAVAPPVRSTATTAATATINTPDGRGENGGEENSIKPLNFSTRRRRPLYVISPRYYEDVLYANELARTQLNIIRTRLFGSNSREYQTVFVRSWAKY